MALRLPDEWRLGEVIRLFVALVVLAGAALLAWRVPAVVPYFLVLLVLVLSNLIGAADQVVGELWSVQWGWVQLLLLVTVLWALVKFFRGGLIFLAFLVLANVSGLATGLQQVSWRLYGLEKRPLAQRVMCPERLAPGAQLYRVTDHRSGHVLLVKAGRSTLSGGGALCVATTRYLPLPDRFDRWDADRNNVRTYMSVNDYRAVVFYPSLKKAKLMFPVKVFEGNMTLPVGAHPRWGVTIEMPQG